MEEIYSWNLIEFRKKYGDINTVDKWLFSCSQTMRPAQLRQLVNTMFLWTLPMYDDKVLVEKVLTSLFVIDSSGDSERRIKLEQYGENANEEKLRAVEAYRQAESERQFETNRINAEKLATKQLGLLQREELGKVQFEKRDAFFNSVQLHLVSDFLGAESYFQDLSVHNVSQNEYLNEKRSFVQSWISNNLNAVKDKKYQPVDDEQASAIAAVNGHVQVIARAGSGKTTTLVNRTLFLLKHCGVAPNQMLLLAFNRKAVLQIRRRLLGLLNEGAEVAVTEEIAHRRQEAIQKNRTARDDLEIGVIDAIAAKLNVVLPHVMTFHALARSTANFDGAILLDEPEGDAQSLSRVFQNVIDDHLQLPEFHHRIQELMLAHFREDWDRIVNGGFDRTKDELLKFRRSLPRESLAGEYVKSYGEKVIADFLFGHGIAYKYERNHWWSGVNYRPDFTIFMSQKRGHENGVVIEYFGLAGDADYDEMSVAKRRYWAAKDAWNLVEFTPIDITGNNVEAFRLLLQARLEKLGVQCVKLSEDEIWHRISERAIDRFTKSIVGFIGRCRKLSWSSDELQAHSDAHVAQSPVETMFLELAHRLYGAYLDRLSATGEDDFDGLMQRAAANIDGGQTLFWRKAGNGDLNALRYICIDEYQDFSDLFFRLLTAIRKQNPTVELFCVGDDWQAINGFAGSDLRFFQDFPKYIGAFRKLHISTNYRSSRFIVDIGNALMHGRGQPAVANKESAGRVLLSDLNMFEPTLLEKQRHPGDSLTLAVLRIANQALVDGLDLVLLCRRNGLPYFVNYGEGNEVHGWGIDRFLNHVRSFFPKGLRERITISTVHKYKGLEKSVVVVLDAVARSYPLIHPDWVFSRIFGDSPAKITAEERRLLYVALTRAIETLVILTEGRSKSPFLEEIERTLALTSLAWTDFPSVSALSDRRLVVQISNQARNLEGAGTYAVKDQIQACRYNWHAVNKVWEKSFPEIAFNFNVVRDEVWATSAAGIDVTVLDDAQLEVASYNVNFGVWICRFDNIDIAKPSDLEVQTEEVR